MSLLAADCLTDPERRLCEAAAQGALLDLRSDRPDEYDDPREGATWGRDRRIRAQVLYQLLTGRGELDAVFGSAVAVRLQGGAVVDPLSLSLLTLRCRLQLLDGYLAGPLDLTKAHVPDVDLQGSHLNGLVAQGLSVTHDLDLRGCTCDHGVDLEGAHVGGSLACSGAQFTNQTGPALAGARLAAVGGVFLDDGFTATGSGGDGAVRLLGAHIGGPLNCRGAKLTNQTGPALTGEGLTAVGGVFFNGGFTATGTSEEGAVRLLGAHIGLQLNCHGAKLTNPTGPALAGDGLTVDANVFLDGGFTAAGAGEDSAVRLLGAHIGGQLACFTAQLTNPTGPALAGDGLTVGGDLFLADGFTAAGAGGTGAVRLLGAHIGGDLFCRGARLTNQTGPALAGDGLTVDGDLFLTDGFTATGSGEDGVVRLSSAHIGGQLNFSGAQLTSNGTQGVVLAVRDASVGSLRLDARLCTDNMWSVDLSGLTYNGIPAGAPLEWWLVLLRDHHSSGYAAQPWQQLAAAHRAAGHEGDARRILIAQQDARRARLLHPSPGDGAGARVRLWGHRTYLWLSKLVVGYGYQTWRAAIGLLLILTLAAGLGVAAGHIHTSKGQYAAARTKATSMEGHPCSTIEQIGLGVDLGLPLIKTNLRARCDLDSATRVGEGFTAVSWVLQAFSWAAATLVVTGYTAVVRRT